MLTGWSWDWSATKRVWRIHEYSPCREVTSDVGSNACSQCPSCKVRQGDKRLVTLKEGEPKVGIQGTIPPNFNVILVPFHPTCTSEWCHSTQAAGHAQGGGAQDGEPGDGLFRCMFLRMMITYPSRASRLQGTCAAPGGHAC